MRTITRYHRPANVREALALLGRDGVESVALAGGTVVNATESGPKTEVVDLQVAIGAGIDVVGDRVEIGAMTRLAHLTRSPEIPSLIRDLAHREGPNTYRNAATAGGTVATGDPESVLLAGFLAFGAEANLVTTAGQRTLAVADLLAEPELLDGAIIESISIESEGAGHWESTGRTPVDTPIVSVIGRRGVAGLTLALTGVASTPILVAPQDIEGLTPLADFRGSSAYRSELARILTQRVLAVLGGGA